jgi:hypothetical protein
MFPENFFVVNPQFSAITYRTNGDSSNYHSLQTQVTLRPNRGISYQGTYTLSRSLGIVGGAGGALGAGQSGIRDLLNRKADYTLQATHRAHDFRSYGGFELPFGPGKAIANNSSGWVARLIEGWEVGSIFIVTSGAPLNIAAQNTLYTTGAPDIVGDFPRKGTVAWPLSQGDIFGNFFTEAYRRVPDPACATFATNLMQWCTLNAVADANGTILLRNANPGELGTLGLRTIDGPGSWDLSANIQKNILIDESRRLTLRMDANNVFNHPNASNPNLNINSGTFGQITSKTGSRTIQAQIRLQF